MPTENRSSNTDMVSVPPYIGLEPLVGRYYPAQCRRCGWVGSSEELTEDDAQCTRDLGDRLCLGDCDELDRDDLLGIIQAMAQPSQQHQVGSVVSIPEGYCIMPKRLTAENGAKALLIGEFKLETTQECVECAEMEEPAEDCEICHGAGEYDQPHVIPWDQIKLIYSEAVKGLALEQ